MPARRPLSEGTGNGGSIFDRIKQFEAEKPFPPPVPAPQPERERASIKHVAWAEAENAQPHPQRHSTDLGLQRMPTYSRHTHSQSTGLLESADLEKLGRSATSQLRHLASFASHTNGDSAFAITTTQDEVAGLHGRRRLQRTKDTSNKAPGYGGRTWMDQQRQFLQAYEYLCHIGEAKEWIEDIIEKPIPRIVELDEALRDGVILAEVVQALNAGRRYKIFQHPKLQYRHSDNIAIFFNYLSDVELPDLFRFELVDLYEKKNIPKVIYCIHALSWLLLRIGVVDFQIGNLVGQLEFEDHELEATQKGLDQAGVSMPNFSSARQGFEEPPPPEPEESPEQIIERELNECLPEIMQLQAQLRGFLSRARATTSWYHMADEETAITELQARVRGNFSRQIYLYRADRKRWAVQLQSACKGYLTRHGEQQKQRTLETDSKIIRQLQGRIRGQQARNSMASMRSDLDAHHTFIVDLQARLRGSELRGSVTDQLNATQSAAPHVTEIQALIRGALKRQNLTKQAAVLDTGSQAITELQALIRGKQQRQRAEIERVNLLDHNIHFVQLQSKIRARSTQKIISESLCELKLDEAAVIDLQSQIRGVQQRQQVDHDLEHLGSCHDEICALQASIRGHLARANIDEDYKALQLSDSKITQLQSCIRGYGERQRIFDQLCEFQEHEDGITGIQSILRGIILREKTGDTIEALEAHEEDILQLQSCARGIIVRHKFDEKRRHFNENMSKVIKIQSFVRGKQQGEAYKSLTTGKNPPVSTVKNFVHLLNDSDFDFEEEVESEKLRKGVGQRVRENEQIQQWIDELDAKIGLLAHNKIARDEYAKIQKHYGGNSLSINRSMSSRDSFNLKALNKTSRAKLELYQELMFLLQTQPRYFSRLFRLTRERGATDADYKRLEMLVNSAFGYTQKAREEYYLLKLIAEAVNEEVTGCASLSDFVRGSYFFSRLFTSYTRSPRDRKYIREITGTVIKTQIIDNTQLDLESDPLVIYRTAINDEELSTGRRSSRNKDVPREEAIRDPQTRDAFIRHLQDMRDVVDHFLFLLEEALPRMPFGTRYVTAQMFDSLRKRFPREDERVVLQTVGNWVWKIYIKPLLADPEHFGIVDRQLDVRQKRNLAELTKVISQAACGKHFGSESVYLQPLNSYMTEAIGRMEEIYARIVEVKDLEAQFDYDEYADLHAKVKPTLHIKAADVFAIHHIIADDVLVLCRGPDDAVLREVIRELGSAKSNEDEMSAGSAEVTLSLSSKNVHSFEDPDADIKALFLETKRCVLYIIRVQAGADLLDVMVKPISAEDEARWSQLVQEELSAGSTKRGAYSDGSTNLLDIASMPYSEMKSIALENMLALQQRGKLSQANHYQDLLNEIAIDIRQKHKRRIQRQRELENVRGTLMHLEDKARSLEETLRAYNDTFEQNLNVLQNKKGKKRFLNPFGKQYGHERELAKQGRTPTYGSFKYSGEGLAEKGILVEWRGRDLRRDDVVIASDQVNQFSIDGMSGHMMIPGAHDSFSWDDLLDAQYQGQRHLKFFGSVDGTGHGELVMDTNLFMQQVSKKFWPEG